jgi:hypothetical protein
VTTESDAESEYLDDMPACTNPAGDTTYLKNSSDAVWLLQNKSNRDATVTPMRPSARASSFVTMVKDSNPGRAIFVPGEELTIDLPPEAVEWTIDLPLSFGWQAHDLVGDKIQEAGEAALADALGRQSPARKALVRCTLAVTKVANETSGLQDADSSDVLLGGLSVGVDVNKCRAASTAVATVDETTGRSVSLAEDLKRLKAQTEVLESVHGKMEYVQRAWKVVGLAGLEFLTHRG